MPRIPSPSLLQQMKAIAFLAVAFACVGPLIRTWQDGAINGGANSGLAAIAIFGGVSIPLAWAALSFFLIRPGTFRDGLITGFLLASASVALCFACWMFAPYLSRPRWFVPDALPWAILHAAVILTLSAACSFLFRRLWHHHVAAKDR